MPKDTETMTKRWIELPGWLAKKIAELAERDHRTEKGQIEYMLAEHVKESEQGTTATGSRPSSK